MLFTASVYVVPWLVTYFALHQDELKRFSCFP